MAGGILHHPKKKFVASLAAGRGLRFFAVAYVGHIYGPAIVSFFSQYYKPVLYALIALAVLGALGALLYFTYYRPQRHSEPVEEFPIPGRGNQKRHDRAHQEQESEYPTHRRTA